MAKVILVCGKICSGKSTYAKRIQWERRAVVLSCDELMLDLFDDSLGEKHDEILQRTKVYLYRLAEQIIRTGSNVILDFGFWSRAERQSLKARLLQKDISCELHYVKVSRQTWQEYLKKRNENVRKGLEKAYYVDENMKRLFGEQFEEPDSDEVDVLVEPEEEE
ncbi:MAG: ATP-binding protein [Ruminococcaceae bacterium]|nr:ATP-binding protein [Oscillospiraceae bacterium]HHV32943.1 ATP-binding protein [Clostridiales bacterium]